MSQRRMMAIMTIVLAVLLIGAVQFAVADATPTQETQAAHIMSVSFQPDDDKDEADEEEGEENEGEEGEEAEESEEAEEAEEADETEEAEEAEEAEETEETEEAEETEEEAAPTPKTIEVDTEELKVEVGIDGTFIPGEAVPVIVKGEEWASFKILETVPHGTCVEEGDVLIEFDPEPLETAIADKERDTRLAEISLIEARLAFEETEAAFPLRTESAEVAENSRQRDFDRYFKIRAELARKSAQRSLDSARFSLEYVQEELRQLEQMYGQDELTEDTEELILTRQRRAVKDSEYRLMLSELSFEETMGWQLEESEEARRRSHELGNLSWRTQTETREFNMEKARLALEKQEISFEREQEKFEELQADLELLTITAPVDGIVYYGGFKAGKYAGVTADKLETGKAWASSDAPIMTIVDVDDLTMAATFPEKELHWITEGLDASVKVTAFPELKLDAEVADACAIPGPDGNFAITLNVDDADGVVPGLGCHADIVVYLNEEAILVPAGAIKEINGKSYVYLAGDDGEEPRRRRVQTGQTQEEKIEILSGLEPGDVILEKAP